MALRESSWLWIMFISLLYVAGAALLAHSLYTVTPREVLEEVDGQVSACNMVKGDYPGTGYNLRVEARLAEYDRDLIFYNLGEKADAVYNHLQVGSHVVLLVEEKKPGKAIIWEGESNGNLFLHYETVAQWHKSNKQWAFGYGLAFLLISSGIATWRIVIAMKLRQMMK